MTRGIFWRGPTPPVYTVELTKSLICGSRDHPLTEHGRDSLTGELYVQCPCEADREYIEGTGQSDDN